MSTLDETLDRLSREFAAQVKAAVLADLRASVSGVFDEVKEAAATTPARPAKRAKPAVAKAAPAMVQARVLDALKGSSGLRTEELSRALALAVTDLSPVVAKLTREGVLTRTGKARGSRYALKDAAPAVAKRAPEPKRTKPVVVAPEPVVTPEKALPAPMTTAAKAVFDAVKANPGSKIAELASANGVSIGEIERELAQLELDGLVKVTSSVSGATYAAAEEPGIAPFDVN